MGKLGSFSVFLFALPGPTDNFLDFSLSDSDEDSLKCRRGEGERSFILRPGDGLRDFRSTWFPMYRSQDLVGARNPPLGLLVAAFSPPFGAPFSLFSPLG